MQVSTRAGELDRIITEADLTTVFQPIVDLGTRQVVAFEALSRGPENSELQFPDVLFPAAAACGLTTALDQACIAASLRAAFGHGLTAPFGLFLNVEAETIDLLATTPPDRPVVVEVTERNLMRDPGGLIRSLRRLRAAGMLIAMDDVGTDPSSLALLPVLQPDIIKLDMGLLQKKPGRNAALVMDAISTYTEHFQTRVVAEGVETEGDLVKAQALGATLGQGWFFGRPTPVPHGMPVSPGFVASRQAVTMSTPYQVAVTEKAPTPSGKPLLIEVSKFLEACALECDETTLVFSTFQQNSNFNARMVERYRALGERATLVAAFVQEGAGQSGGLTGTPKLRIVPFAEDDELASEWSVIVLNSRYCAMLTAREVPDHTSSVERFEFVLTHDRGLVSRAAITLASRL